MINFTKENIAFCLRKIRKFLKNKKSPEKMWKEHF